MRKLILYLFFLIPNVILAKDKPYQPNHKYTEAELVTDFDFFFKTLIQVHPSIYEFTGKETLPLLHEKLKSKISEGTELDLLELVSNILVKVHCGHTVAFPSSEWYANARKKGQLISLSIKLINNELYIWNHAYSDSISLQGHKIISINNLKSEVLIKKLRNRIPGDGVSGALPTHTIQRSFRTMLAFSEGFSPKYKVVFSGENNSIDSILLPANSKLPKLKKSNTNLETFLLVDESDGVKYYEFVKDKTIALIDIDGFKRSKFKAFYKTVFKKIDNNQTKHLILDLRNNGGGYFPNGNELLTYFFDEDIYFTFSRPDHKIEKSKYLKMNTFSKLTKVLFGIIPDEDKQNRQRDYRIKYKVKKKNRFNGKIYVLTNNGSFSMSGYVAAKLNTLENTTIIGQETGGGEYGSNAILSYTLTLPNTKVRINLPYYFLDHQIPNLKKGRGIIPDHKIDYTIADFMAQKDKEMSFVLAQILKTK